MQTITADPSMTQARERFQTLLAQHEPIVRKVASMYCRNGEDRRDLAQEIAIHAWRSFGRYDATRAFPTWLYRVALNVAISHARATGLRDRHAMPLDEQAHEIADERHSGHEDDERLRALHRCIAALAPLDRALMLLYLDERSHAEIAEVLGIGASNVGTRINRLKQRIRDALVES